MMPPSAYGQVQDDFVLYLAMTPNGPGYQHLCGKARFSAALSGQPSILVSYYYLLGKSRRALFLDDLTNGALKVRFVCIDSGAFSAFHKNVVIDVDDYIEFCKTVAQEAWPKVREIFALDVIGDWKASARNTERMWNAGVPAIPTYHIGEPEQALRDMAKHYPKIAIGGMATLPHTRKSSFLRHALSLVWPKKVHALGACTWQQLQGVPVHSADATSWSLCASAYGVYKSMNGVQLSVRPRLEISEDGTKREFNLRSEIEFFLQVERRMNDRWKKDYQQLATHSMDWVPPVASSV